MFFNQVFESDISPKLRYEKNDNFSKTQLMYNVSKQVEMKPRLKVALSMEPFPIWYFCTHEELIWNLSCTIK